MQKQVFAEVLRKVEYQARFKTGFWEIMIKPGGSVQLIIII
jgi:hypothetical protein